MVYLNSILLHIRHITLALWEKWVRRHWLPGEAFLPTLESEHARPRDAYQ